MDSSILIGILIGVVVVLAILALRKAGSGTNSSSGGPSVRRVDDPGVSMTDKRAAKSAAIAKRSRLKSKRVPYRAPKQAEPSTRRTGLKKRAAESPSAPAISNKRVKKTSKTKTAPEITKDVPRKSGKKTTAPSKDVASRDAKDSNSRHMID
ncbi:MAG: hypothetical protein PF636_00095 [Actinomycetota bacterium]|nr:hypothetical protein [Actinomycetota bacterium]